MKTLVKIVEDGNKKQKREARLDKTSFKIAARCFVNVNIIVKCVEIVSFVNIVNIVKTGAIVKIGNIVIFLKDNKFIVLNSIDCSVLLDVKHTFSFL